MLNIYILTKGYLFYILNCYRYIVWENYFYSNKAVDKYLSPVSGSKTTIFLPLFSGLLASSVPACIDAPADIPTNKPSVFATALDALNASSFSTGNISSTISKSNTLGTNPAPIPWILCGPGLLPESTADVAGSTATIFAFGFCDFMYFPIPVTVPPVPTPATNISTFPSVSLQISGPVV